MKNIIYEFSGIPGSGKSTVYKELKKEKIKIYGREEINDFCIRHKNIFGILKVINLSFCNNLKQVISKYNDVPIYYYDSVLQLYMVPRFLALFKKDIFYIFDEGFIQCITSIIHKQCLVEDKYLDKLITNINKRYDISCFVFDINTDEAKKRIRKRGGRNRVDSFDDDELIIFLDKKRDDIFKIGNMLDNKKMSRLNYDCKQIMETINYR